MTSASIPLLTSAGRCFGASWRCRTVQIGPEMRRGIADLDGEGEGRWRDHHALRKNALATIEAVKAKLQSLKASLPKGVEIVPVYDRSQLIERAVAIWAQAAGRVHRGRAGLLGLPVSPALGAGGDHFAAAGRTRGLHRHALPGRQRQHHVAGRHRHRHRRHGRCRRRHDRERPQAPGAWRRASERARAESTGR